MSGEFTALFQRTRPAFSDPRVFEQARTIALAQLLCLGRHTVTGLLTTCGRTEQDWSSVYRLFEHERVDRRRLFELPAREVAARLPPAAPFVAMMDDTLIRKRGRKVSGASWRRDPLGPPFRPNFIWGQRFLQISAADPESHTGPSRARAVPIAFEHCPSPRRPSRRAPQEEWDHYRRCAKAAAVTRRGSEEIARLREQLDRDGHADRELVLAVDGTFTNRTVLTNLPPRTTVIGRIRKDAKLFAPPPPETPRRGQPRRYGERMQTPEQVRQDQNIAWTKVKAFAAGRVHEFEVKSVCPCRWKNAGGIDCRLVVIRPLAYRTGKGRRLLYRDPAYLLCTNPAMSLEQVVQYYAWRWEIELNFREEKTLLGAGEGQVRTPAAASSLPAFKVATYAILLCAHRNLENHGIVPLPRPKWQEASAADNDRMTTVKMIGRLRAETWGKALGWNNEGFESTTQPNQKPPIIENAASKAVIYAFR